MTHPKLRRFTCSPPSRAGALLALAALGAGAGCGRLLGIEPGVMEGPPGTLDTTFGVGGIATVPLGDVNLAADGALIGPQGLAVEPDGRIVFCGNAPTDSTAELVVGRLTADGRRDTGFGTGGLVMMNAPGHSQDVCLAVRLLPSGGVALGGFALGPGSPHMFLAAQFTAAGAPDPHFGGGGFVSTTIDVDDISVDAKATDLALQSDGKLVLAGYAGTVPTSSSLLRLLPNGAADPTFGPSGDGIAQGLQPGAINAVVELAGGQLLTAISSTGFSAAQFTAAGAIDPLYGADGYATAPASAALIVGGIGIPFPGAQGVVAQPDGQAVFSGATVASGGAPGAIALARFNGSGQLDPGFGQDGLVSTTIPGGDAMAGALALTQDGGFAVCATLSTGAPIGVVRYDATGALDASFADGGYADIPGIAGTVRGEAIAIDAAGRILVGGFVMDGATNTAAVVIARFWP